FGTYAGPAPVTETNVVLNELYPAPYSAGEPAEPFDREWVELYNGGGAATDVLGWFVNVDSTAHEIVASCAADPNTMAPWSGDTEIGADDRLVLEFCNNGANNKMPNGGAEVSLLDSSSAVVD